MLSYKLRVLGSEKLEYMCAVTIIIGFIDLIYGSYES